MNNDNYRTNVVMRVFSIIYSATAFLYGLFLTIVMVKYYSNYEYLKPFYYYLRFALYLALPVAVSILCFLGAKNKKLALPSFVLTFLMIPGINPLSWHGITMTPYVYNYSYYSYYGQHVTLLYLTAVFFYLCLSSSLALLIVSLINLAKNKSEPYLNIGSAKENIDNILKPEPKKTAVDDKESLEIISKAKILLDNGAITEEEFKKIKSKVL